MCGAGTYIRACIGISGQQFLLVTAVVCWWRHLLLGCDTISSTCCRRDSVVGVSISFIFVITSLQKNCKKLYKITINGKRRQKITEEITKKNRKLITPSWILILLIPESIETDCWLTLDVRLVTTPPICSGGCDWKIKIKIQ